MALLELDDIKFHLNVELEDPMHDTYLTSLGAAAARACELRTGRWIDPQDKPEGSLAADFSEADLETLRHAARLMIGTWFTNREGVTTGSGSTPELPLGVTYLLDPLRDFSGR